MSYNPEEQKKIFAKNLNHYIEVNRKQQNEVAKDLGFNPTTLNMWCKGNSMPTTGKIRALADYFGIGITDLTDRKIIATSENLKFVDLAMKLSMSDDRIQKIIIGYNELSVDDKKIFCDFCERFVLHN